MMTKPTALLLFAAAILLTACFRTPERIELTVNGESYSIDLADNTAVDLLTLSTEFDAEVSVANFRQFERLSVGGVPLQEGKASFPVDYLGKDAFLALEWGSHHAGGTVLLRTLPVDVPDAITAGRASTPGDFYLSYVFLRLIQKYDNSGNLIYFRYEPRTVRGGDDSSGWWDFKKHTVDDRTYYSYHAPDTAFSDRSFLGYNPGKRVLLDDRYRPLGEIHLLADATGRIHDGDPIDGHDFYLFDLEHYIVSAYIERDGVYAAYLQEVQDGKVVFDWWSTDHPELAEWLDPAFAESAGKDYVHFNSIDILPDGNWLCSLRHVSSLVKIDRVGGTGDILWRIAGMEQPAAYSFCGQHCARWHGEDSAISLFNNGNDRGLTGLVRLTVEPESGIVVDGKELLRADDRYYSQACGSLTFSGDHFIAGWGIPDPSGAVDRVVTEYDAAGNEVFGIRRDRETLRKGFVATYRCVKE